ncbi:MAG TPA: UDP-3-O-(3-hydroxymyristoyl)glucosamine N-acyltransferase [Gemmatimonadaceae bacterium]|nr:UDP-3-O-(3-hydroxymyristoyl)glucosamine N-acyltransferase [Gemmatimonadaceae bacterium]
MADPRFFDNHGPLTIDAIEALVGAVRKGPSTAGAITDVASLETAGPGHLSFCERANLKATLAASRASAVLVTDAVAELVPGGATCLVSRAPALAFAKVAAALYPDAGTLWSRDHPPAMAIDPSASIGEGTVIAPGAFVGPGVEIGRGATIAPGAVIGRGVRIGDGTRIGPLVTLSHALIGNRVTIHGGTAIGQDGFGYIGSAAGHYKIPQLGRVLIHDDVEIGANTTIDRGALGDTDIGMGTKIDNLCQIGHNTRLGRHCVLAGQVGLSGSVTLGDFVVLGGQVAVSDHVTIGTGARVAGRSGVTRDLEAGKTYGGFPAMPIGAWRREVVILARLAARRLRDPEREAPPD